MVYIWNPSLLRTWCSQPKKPSGPFWPIPTKDLRTSLTHLTSKNHQTWCKTHSHPQSVSPFFVAWLPCKVQPAIPLSFRFALQPDFLLDHQWVSSQVRWQMFTIFRTNYIYINHKPELAEQIHKSQCILMTVSVAILQGLFFFLMTVLKSSMASNQG